MKHCPNCQRTYPDGASDFCVQDGARLVSQTTSSELQPTMYAASAPTPAQPPTGSPFTPAPPSQSSQFNQSPMGQMPGNYNPTSPQQSSPSSLGVEGRKRKGLAIVSLLFGFLSVIAAIFFLLFPIL